MEITKLNLGSGRRLFKGFTNIDCIQIIDNNDKKLVDVVMDIDNEQLPYADNQIDEIIADNVLEHIENLKFVLNECHRVLKQDGTIRGCVPLAGTNLDFRDPTHKRHFVMATFDYFSGQAEWTNDKKPKHPRYADYGFLSWEILKLGEEEGLINFFMRPIK